MLAFLLPLASKISDAVAQIPENEELGEKLVEICLVILAKAVKLTKTDMDDQLLEVVRKRLKREKSEFINISMQLKLSRRKTWHSGAITIILLQPEQLPLTTLPVVVTGSNSGFGESGKIQEGDVIRFGSLE